MGDDARFERFRRLVLDDITVQERLRGVIEWPAFVTTALQVAAEHGVELTTTDLEAALAC